MWEKYNIDSQHHPFASPVCLRLPGTWHGSCGYHQYLKQVLVLNQSMRVPSTNPKSNTVPGCYLSGFNSYLLQSSYDQDRFCHNFGVKRHILLYSLSEMKVEFAERFYTFKMSDKVAVIPIKRHFAHGYATLKWQTQWSKTQEEPESSSSSSEDENVSGHNSCQWKTGLIPDSLAISWILVWCRWTGHPVSSVWNEFHLCNSFFINRIYSRVAK